MFDTTIVSAPFHCLSFFYFLFVTLSLRDLLFASKNLSLSRIWSRAEPDRIKTRQWGIESDRGSSRRRRTQLVLSQSLSCWAHQAQMRDVVTIRSGNKTTKMSIKSFRFKSPHSLPQAALKLTTVWTCTTQSNLQRGGKIWRAITVSFLSIQWTAAFLKYGALMRNSWQLIASSTTERSSSMSPTSQLSAIKRLQMIAKVATKSPMVSGSRASSRSVLLISTMFMHAFTGCTGPTNCPLVLSTTRWEFKAASHIIVLMSWSLPTIVRSRMLRNILTQHTNQLLQWISSTSSV
jgi:hypothetical protein